MSTNEDDETLFGAWIAGDPRSGELLVERHFSSVYRFFSRRIDDSDVVRELAQVTFLALVENNHLLREGIRFRAFALGIARNRLAEHFRQQARRDAHAIRATPTPDATTPSRVAAAREEQRVLLLAMRALPLDLQITLEMHYWEGLTTKEIGVVLDVPAGTVKWRLSRARALLKSGIEAIAPEDIRRSTVDNLDAWASSLRDREPD